MANCWRLFCVGFLLTTFSAFGQTGSPAKGPASAERQSGSDLRRGESTSETGWSESPTPTPTATPVVFSPQTLSDLKRLRDAALKSDYAYKQVAHLANNIGPRLTGSAQAAKAVEYVSGELKAIGCEVQLEKVMVPHWVRGIETAELTQFPGQAAGTTQKIVLCALGGSVPPPAGGIIADIISVRDFDELKSLAPETVNVKIVLFNHRLYYQLSAQVYDIESYC